MVWGEFLWNKKSRVPDLGWWLAFSMSPAEYSQFWVFFVKCGRSDVEDGFDVGVASV